ncbi:3,4-dihydroxy-2-butanone-4-phosphate synthase [Hansschlegelia quercus]|uniref:3,4-dihydroxy-2-butanone 4-phosphate synthase n=2 Tax=Hansschlegelia quercus TaxID=2528245 RepID=A0A4Q9GQN2_9HYPH|nr:3,4-dihydroxy-2-butanone-4-phosphate synthase [Hansschlegelia quercus]
MVVLIDDEDRENEGDLVVAAEFATPAVINFMATHARGLICLVLTPRRVEELGLRPMVEHNGCPRGTGFTVSVEAKEGVTTGISAFDRAHTIATVIDPAMGGADLVSPGHVFPLRAREGGLLERPGHTEAAVDVARLAGLSPAGVICEIMSADGHMARTPELVAFARRHGLRIGTVAALARYRVEGNTPYSLGPLSA